MDKGWKIISPEIGYNGYQITFPWGWIRATQPVTPECKNPHRDFIITK